MDPTTTPDIQQEVPYEEDLNPQSPFPRKKLISLIVGVVVCLIIIIVAFAVFILPPKPPGGPVTLTYWGLWEDSQVFDQVIKDYTAKHSDVTIKYEKQDIKNIKAGYVEFLQSRIKFGTGPDIYRYHNSWTDQLRAYLAPFPKDVVDTIGIKDKYFSVVGEDVMRNGAYYGVPLGIDTLSLIVNDDIIKAGGYQYPTDWDYLIDLSRQITVVDQTNGDIKTSGVALGSYDNIDHAADIVSLLFVQSGVNFQDLISSDEQKVASAKSRIKTALEYYTCFARDGDICQRVWDDNMDRSRLAFAKGNVAMIFGYSWDILEIEMLKKQFNPELKYSVHPVPHLPQRDQTIASYWVEGVSSSSKNKDAAFEFLKYLSSQEVQTKIYTERAKQRTLSVVYPHSDMASSITDNPYLAPFASQAKSARSTPFSSDTYDGATGTNSTVNTALQRAIGEILSGNVSVDTAVNTLVQNVQTNLKKYAK